MPIYHSLGKIPPKRHTQFRNPKGDLYHEQLFGTIGFDGMSTLSYHLHPPTQIIEVLETQDAHPHLAVTHNIKSRKFISYDQEPGGNYLESRDPLMVNNDIHIGIASPSDSMKDFYKNADADELIFVQKGKGKLRTHLGTISFEQGDYLVIPRGIIFLLEMEESDCRLFYAESFHPIYTPKKYRNWFGQLLEHSPYCERDYKLPGDLETHDQQGEFLVNIKKQNKIHQVVYASHPFDVVGWDGYNFPYGISIHDFEPITGRIHQPPPVHQMFETSAFVVCSFCPRLYDYHPQAIPAPYNHSNIDSDEVLYYVDGDFMSRKGIAPGHISLHPAGIPHGPHPGTYEGSIGKKETKELAVMIDTFKPLQLTAEALRYDDGDYYQSWLKG